MANFPLTLGSFPRAILHIDGDAFFASCEQSRNPELRGKPVVTGKERGIAASMSYEAKAKGVIRGMRLSDIKKVCPDVILLPSDYETYSLLSKRFYDIVRRYTPDVEEYSIDECFADLTGLQRVFRKSYKLIAEEIKHHLDTELGFTFSAGLAPSKVLAKVGSKWKKPSGLTVIPGRDAHIFLDKLPAEKIWGIGPQTSAMLAKHRVYTALQYAHLDEDWIKKYMTKPYYEIWQELRGNSVLAVDTKPKEKYISIQKMKTFTPPSDDQTFIFAQLSKNIENACIKARRYKLVARDVIIFLRTLDFRDRGFELRLSRPTSFAHEIIEVARQHFNTIYRKGLLYRSTGIILANLKQESEEQPDLFNAHLRVEKFKNIYSSIDAIKEKYGKHTLFLGSSFMANKFSQHLGERGDEPSRKNNLFKGENQRQRLAIPMLGYEL